MTRNAHTRRVVTVVIALAMGFLAGLLVQQPAPSVPRGNSEPPPLPPTPTKQGAVDSAVAYVMSLRWDVLVDDRRRKATIARLATPDAAPELDAELGKHLEPIRAAVATPPVVARRAVLGTSVNRFDPPEASVSLWGLAVFATGSYGPVTQWSASELALEWRGGRWRVAGVSSEGGPSPESSLNRLARADAEFEEVNRVP